MSASPSNTDDTIKLLSDETSLPKYNVVDDHTDSILSMHFSWSDTSGSELTGHISVIPKFISKADSF
uniref:Uncharacterized protein n=1 Tax=Arion vulgaris TaxID=1028688 RepID=A0A0B6ZAX8_9EUPU